MSNENFDMPSLGVLEQVILFSYVNIILSIHNCYRLIPYNE